jgi:septal ring factor EnvC (AmiA/AmiB activator)
VKEMLDLRKKFLVFSLLVISLLNSGCATIQRAKKVEELEREISRLTQLIEERDARLNQLHKQFQEIELGYEKERERLYKELNELRTRLKTLKKEQPAFK